MAKYYAMIDGRQQGPYELEELPAAGVRPSTYIWCKGMPDWQKAEEDPEVCRLFRNRLYDIMHPDLRPQQTSDSDTPANNDSADAPSSPVSFRHPGVDLPSLEEIDNRIDKTKAPPSMVGYAWLVTIFCFFPTGIAALVCAYKSKREWKAGNNEAAHSYAQSARMWTGISFFLGLIGYAFILAFV